MTVMIIMMIITTTTSIYMNFEWRLEESSHTCSAHTPQMLLHSSDEQSAYQTVKSTATSFARPQKLVLLTMWDSSSPLKPCNQTNTALKLTTSALQEIK